MVRQLIPLSVNDLISVILPTFNRAGYLKRAIDSVIDQQRPPDELIIIDDGSTDNSTHVVHEACRRAEFPVHLLHQENRGTAAARNAGILKARGELLCFLDSDDWWDPRKIALQAAEHEKNPDIHISHTREIWFRNGVRVNQKKKHAPPNGFIFSACLRMCVVGMSTVMVRRKLFDRFGLFDTELPCCEDYDLWLRVARKVPFLLVDHALTLKEGGRPDQLSQIYRQGMDQFRIRSLCNLLKSDLLSPDQKQEAVAELERKCRIYGNGCIKHGRQEEGEQYLALPARYQHALAAEQPQDH